MVVLPTRSLLLVLICSSCIGLPSILALTRSDMKQTRDDGLGGEGMTLTPSSGSYSKVILWFHGLGDTADGWGSMMPSLGIDDTKFILPTASVRPISLNGGMPMPGWSDIFGLDHNANEDREGFEESRERVHRLIQKEIDNNIEGSNIVIGGFSQGGALALHVALRHPTVSFGGCVALSTWLPLRADFPDALSGRASNLRIFQAHGSADNVVNHRWGQESHHALKTLIPSPEPEFLTIERMGHSSHPREMEAVKTFIKSVFSM